LLVASINLEIESSKYQKPETRNQKPKSLNPLNS